MPEHAARADPTGPERARPTSFADGETPTALPLSPPSLLLFFSFLFFSFLFFSFLSFFVSSAQTATGYYVSGSGFNPLSHPGQSLVFFSFSFPYRSTGPHRSIPHWLYHILLLFGKPSVYGFLFLFP